jgi:predicted flap endonuclease-1-like 5' DNA nuclease
MDVLRDYWWLIVIALALVAFLLFRPRQRVTLTDSAPVRPHMAGHQPAEGRGLGGEMAAAATDVSGDILNSRVHQELEADPGHEDDLCRLKGVGPKFATALKTNGIYRFEQLAALSPDAALQLDERLGTFRGRVTRDRLVEQARYLAADDRAGFEAQFGKL